MHADTGLGGAGVGLPTLALLGRPRTELGPQQSGPERPSPLRIVGRELDQRGAHVHGWKRYRGASRGPPAAKATGGRGTSGQARSPTSAGRKATKWFAFTARTLSGGPGNDGSACQNRLVLTVHRSDRADALADALAGLLSEPLADPLAPEVVSVPTRGMERWLAQRVSGVLGAAPGGARRCVRERPLPLPPASARRCRGRRLGD